MKNNDELTPEEIEHLTWFEEHYGKEGTKIEILTGKNDTIVYKTITKRYELKKKARAK